MNFCCEVGLIKFYRTFSRCRRTSKLIYDNRKDDSGFALGFRCYNRKRSIFDKYNSHLWVQEILILCCIFARGKYDYEAIKYEYRLTDDSIFLSSRTISDWLTFIREVCIHAVLKISDGKIGGPGLTVEKIHLGRVIDGKWVVGGICRETKDVFLVPCHDNKRNGLALVEITTQNVNPGSLIITDCWKGYEGLTQEGWDHLTVNHSYNFVDPFTEAHTQNIENLWWQVKRSLPDTYTRKDGSLFNHFGEFLWRKKIITEPSQAFLVLLKHAAGLYPPPK
ncbi:hypothetical protein RF11_04044 [Thelohanellus kitauei]|uniref:ISXO2-like transposase domain-containing protein n=1 Tax=Thelohanellus kitauei TaxID=669202 RepID=A0A0C2J130_THEKT|nr:hypothetical protein RF11_04044 [Thelohanellus kitauei]